MKTIVLSLPCLMAVLTGTASAAVFYVHPESTQNCIQDCLDACSDNDTVLVGAGTYVENIVWPAAQGIKLISEHGRDTTVIDGGGVDRVVDFPDPIDTTTVLSGFTVTNGYAEFGAGIRCDTSASPLIADNLITLNIAYGTQYGHGGGIGVKNDASPIVRGNVISRNRATGSWSGGGGIVCLAGSAPLIEDNAIEGNWSSAGGGGIMCADYSAATIAGNVIRYDTSNASGAGICCQRSRTVIYGNTITHNCDPAWPGDGISTCADDSSLIRRNTVSLNFGSAVAIVNRNNGSRIDSCTIADNLGPGIYTDAPDVGTVVRHCDITGNAGCGVQKVSPDTRLDARENWWGHATGPFHPDSNPAGQGDTVSDYVDFSDWLTSPVGVSEPREPSARRTLGPASVVGGGLLLPAGGEALLLDITGRKVADLAPGPNDVRHISPGVYFLHEQGKSSLVRKVIVTR